MSYLAQVDVLKALPTNTDQEKLFKAFALGAAFTAGFFCDVVKDETEDHEFMLKLALKVGSLIIKKESVALNINAESYMNIVEQRLLEYAEQSRANNPKINHN